MENNEVPTNESAVTVSIGGPTDTAEKSPTRHRKKWMAVGLLSLLVGLIIFAIAYPLTRNRKSKDSISAKLYVEHNSHQDSNSSDLVHSINSTYVPSNEKYVEHNSHQDSNSSDLVYSINSTYVPNNEKYIEDENSTENANSSASNTTNTDKCDYSSSATPLVRDRPFHNVSLPLFSPSITKTYTNTKTFDKDLTDAAALLSSKSLKRNLKVPGYENVGLGNSNQDDFEILNYDRTDFQTNNQEKGVDEADVVKADNTYIYAAYSDYIVVWDTLGNQIAQLKMPQNGAVGNNDTVSVESGEPSTGNPNPITASFDKQLQIESLMLTSGYLIVFVSGYGKTGLDQEGTQSSILYDYLGTQIRVYRTNTLPDKLEYVGKKNVHGRYLDARSIGSSVHVATVSGIDTYSTLVAPLDRETRFPDLSDEEYIAAAQELATETTIPNFVCRLREDLSLPSGEFPNMLQVNQWQTTGEESVARNSQQDELMSIAFGEGVADYVALVTSFDVMDDELSSASDIEITVSSSSFLSPSSWIHMYGTEDKLILATQGWNWNPTTASQEQATYLLGMALDGATTNFISVGTVPGHLLNPFALDIVGNDVRVATTIRKRWILQPLPVVADVVITTLEEDVDKVTTTTFPLGVGPETESSINETSTNEPAELLASPQHQPQHEIVHESLTENYVIVLDLEGDINDGQMIERGRVRIGEIHEEITAVRFFDDVAYIVTFASRDPFYVVDLKTPAILGEFKRNGFSSYLHSLNDDNTLLIGVGQNVTSEGQPNGLMITIFNVSIPESPVAMVSYGVENRSHRSYSRSTSEWEHKSFRYWDGKLIIPLREFYDIMDAETGVVHTARFQGFVVYNVTTTSIVEHFRVSHSSRVCHYCGYLPPRSFIYDGNLMTMEDNIVASTNLDNSSELWTLDIVIEGEDANCCPHMQNGAADVNDDSVPISVEDDPFSVNLPHLSNNITRHAYTNEHDFDEDLAEAAKLLLNNVVKRNLKIPGYEYVGLGTGGFFRGVTDEAAMNVGDVTDFQTNVQEQGVDEADIVKADENYVYAAYGDYIVVWDTHGKKITQAKMPNIPGGDVFAAGMSDSRRPNYYMPRPHIESMLVASDYIVVFVSGYGSMFQRGRPQPSILFDYLGTQIRVYRTTNLPNELEFVGKKNINGRFLDARSIGHNIHVATTSEINTNNYLVAPLDRYVHFPSLSDDEYLVAAIKQARETVIPEFVARFREELSASGEFPKMLQLTRWQNCLEQKCQLSDIAFGEGIVNSVAWVTSFDVTSELSSSEELEVSTSSFVAPSSWIHLYGTTDMLVLATQGWNWIPDLKSQEQTTYLIVLEVDGADTNFISVGNVAGHLLNSFALDIRGNDLRVATTIRNRWRFRPMWVRDAGVELENQNIPEEIVEESSTENYVIVLELDNEVEGQMAERGRVQLGEIHEAITAVRFFDEVAYVVTFERTDPFYVIDLETPAKLGEFKLNGFSSYLHSMNDDNTLLIGVGQNATDEGRITGLMITVFNASTPETPVALVSYTLEDRKNGHSSSVAEWEHKSFRYINGKLIIPLQEYYHTFDEETGARNYDSFRGFVVFNISTSSIAEHFRVSHNTRVCHYCGYLPPRSFIYEGNLLTVEDSVVTSTNLDTATEVWTIDIAIEGETANCCPFFTSDETEKDEEDNLPISEDDLFNISLPYFSNNITQEYQETLEFDKDLTEAAKLLLNNVLRRNLNFAGYDYVGMGSSINVGMLENVMTVSAPNAPPAPPVQESGVLSSVGDVTDFDTNIQERGVDEADVIKADENYVYAAYGNYVVVWDKDGRKITQLKMPAIPTGGTNITRMIAPEWHNPRPHIESFMLASGYLVVFVSGYGRALRQERGQRTILYEYLGTQVRTYRTTTLPLDLEFVGMKNINGRFLDARSMGNNVHVSTVSGIDTYNFLINPVDRRLHFSSLSDREYLIAAKHELMEVIFPDFVNRLREELSTSEKFPNMLQLNRWQAHKPEISEISDIAFGEGIVNNVAFITSFDVTDHGSSSEELEVSISSFLSPYSWIQMYGTEDRLIMATQGWNFNPTRGSQEQSTYLLGLGVDGPTTSFISVGTVPGNLVNSFALDIQGNDLRVATTIRKRWVARPMPLIQPIPAVNTEDSTNINESDLLESVVELELNILPAVEPEALPSTPEFAEEIVEESSTENYVIVLEIDSDMEGEMVERGRVQLGEIHEAITAVRFFDEVAYVVTFERTDPFYVIDLETPAKLGEFKLNGFSSYLHSMNDDNTLLIGVGQNATDEGRVTGLMITVFNASTPDAPVAVVSHTVGDSDNGYSGSAAEWEHKSFRYINGKLIIPLNENYQTLDEQTGRVHYVNFRGFVVFNISETSIAEHFRVSHNSRGCNSCGYLPPRSFIYDGNLMTVQDNVVTSTNLDNSSELWSMDLVIDGEPATCCPHYLP